MNPDFSYQPDCVDRIEAALKEYQRVIPVAPCASGKTRMITMLFQRELDRGGRPIVFTNRRVVRKQLSQALEERGIRVGNRAAGMKPDLHCPAQVASIPTEAKRSLNAYHPWSLHRATIAIIDEAHENKSQTARDIMDAYEAARIVTGKRRVKNENQNR